LWRLVTERRVERGHKFDGALRTLGGLLREHLQDERVEPLRHLRAQLAHRLGSGVRVEVHDRQRRVGQEWGAAREHLVEHATQRVDV
jgi:hypothetical protein